MSTASSGLERINNWQHISIETRPYGPDRIAGERKVVAAWSTPWLIQDHDDLFPVTNNHRLGDPASSKRFFGSASDIEFACCRPDVLPKPRTIRTKHLCEISFFWLISVGSSQIHLLIYANYFLPIRHHSLASIPSEKQAQSLFGCGFTCDFYFYSLGFHHTPSIRKNGSTERWMGEVDFFRQSSVEYCGLTYPSID
ncbi:hypothetical protein [Paenibacillus elgii]|uniref:hypothetical protein n=1 Tax=Paenibacillus elgii TaxID=189691 RepID=UPI0013D5A856|nr:hypothetical protein [Paenibacillus elgii]